jgi:hypothetical protein
MPATKLPPDSVSEQLRRVELQLDNVATRIELLRLVWLQTCESQCFPPVEHDIDLLQREFNDLRALITTFLSSRNTQDASGLAT